MIIHCKLYLLAAIVGLLVTACAPAISAAPTVTPSGDLNPAYSCSYEHYNTQPDAHCLTLRAGTFVSRSCWQLDPVNSPEDCPSCTGFVDRYTEAITAATGRPVDVQNLSQHNSLQIDGLLQELETDSARRVALANADIILVSIAHNDTAWNRNDDPCDGSSEDWSKFK